jgi:hypothetical protein
MPCALFRHQLNTQPIATLYRGEPRTIQGSIRRSAPPTTGPCGELFTGRGAATRHDADAQYAYHWHVLHSPRSVHRLDHRAAGRVHARCRDGQERQCRRRAVSARTVIRRRIRTFATQVSSIGTISCDKLRALRIMSSPRLPAMRRSSVRSGHFGQGEDPRPSDGPYESVAGFANRWIQSRYNRRTFRTLNECRCPPN